MNIMRKKILDLPGVYSTAALNLDGKLYFAVASENRGEKAYIIDADSLEYSLLWDRSVCLSQLRKVFFPRGRRPGCSLCRTVTG